MKIRSVEPNNRRKAFKIEAAGGTYVFPYANLRLRPTAENRVAKSPLSKREIIRRLGTSASQFYRLLDPTNSTKSVGQLVALLHILDFEVDVVVRPRPRRTA